MKTAERFRNAVTVSLDEPFELPQLAVTLVEVSIAFESAIIHSTVERTETRSTIRVYFADGSGIEYSGDRGGQEGRGSVERPHMLRGGIFEHDPRETLDERRAEVHESHSGPTRDGRRDVDVTGDRVRADERDGGVQGVDRDGLPLDEEGRDEDPPGGREVRGRVAGEGRRHRDAERPGADGPLGRDRVTDAERFNNVMRVSVGEEGALGVDVREALMPFEEKVADCDLDPETMHAEIRFRDGSRIALDFNDAEHSVASEVFPDG